MWRSVFNLVDLFSPMAVAAAAAGALIWFTALPNQPAHAYDWRSDEAAMYSKQAAERMAALMQKVDTQTNMIEQLSGKLDRLLNRSCTP